MGERSLRRGVTDSRAKRGNGLTGGPVQSESERDEAGGGKGVSIGGPQLAVREGGRLGWRKRRWAGFGVGGPQDFRSLFLLNKLI